MSMKHSYLSTAESMRGSVRYAKALFQNHDGLSKLLPRQLELFALTRRRSSKLLLLQISSSQLEQYEHDVSRAAQTLWIQLAAIVCGSVRMSWFIASIRLTRFQSFPH